MEICIKYLFCSGLTVLMLVALRIAGPEKQEVYDDLREKHSE